MGNKGNIIAPSHDVERPSLWQKLRRTIFYIHSTKAYSYVRVLGVRLFSSRRDETSYTKYILGLPYKGTRMKGNQKKKYFLGVCYKKYENSQKAFTLRNEYEASLLQEVALRAQMIYSAHQQIFSKYKGIHHGEDIVLIATGPTLNDAPRIRKAVCIGVNRTITMKQYSLNYCFMQDYTAVKDYIEHCFEYDCVKFFGLFMTRSLRRLNIPYVVGEKAQAERYYGGSKDIVYPDIACYPLADCGTVSHAALHFSIYTRPRRIYLIGCDTSADGYYDKTLVPVWPLNPPLLRSGYQKIKEMSDIFYPDVEIISVNPVGLRGLFRDVYTSSYLEKHPEIKNAEILDVIG